MAMIGLGKRKWRWINVKEGWAVEGRRKVAHFQDQFAFSLLFGGSLVDPPPDDWLFVLR